ncbi:MAG: hypothetical protein KC420_06135, partial [Myxococcales bacterium]|nr:hypothetical protein [Myxococcales bacterium]
MPLRALLREPLVHFVVAGGLLFGLHRLVAPPPAIAGEVVIDREWARAVGGELGRALGRPPAADELAGALVDAVDQELLYREGLALGLDRGDPIVRRRVIQRARFLHEDRAELAAIDDAALAEELAAAPERYRLPPRIALTHVFVAGDRAEDPEAEARRLLAALEGGDDP